MKAIHRGNGPSWNRIINWANTFIVAAFLFYTSSGFAGNSTNTLWLSLSGVSNGWLTLTLNGTQPGSNYTLLSQATLTASNWNAAGQVTGAQNQSWTAVQVPLTGSVWFVRAQYYQSNGGGGTNSGGSGTNSGTSGYGTNLWLSSGGVANGIANLAVVNSAEDVWYEIQGKTNLLQPDWISYGFVSGSELTNWTSVNFPVNPQGNLFLRIRSWADSYNSGIPDWWWLQYFGQMTNVNAYAADPAGDGYSNWQKFQMGLNPTNYYNPNAPTNFFGCLDMTGTNVVLEWSPPPGPVTGYVIQRGILNTNTGNYDYSQFAASSNTIFFRDVGAISNDNAWNNIYNLQAVYPGGTLTATDTWYASWYPSYYPPYGAPWPGDAYAYVDASGTNVFISWTAAQGPLIGYGIEFGIYDSTNDDFDYFQIAMVSTNTTLFEVIDGITNTIYGIVAVYPGGGVSRPAAAYPYSTPPPPTGLSATVDSTGTNVLISWTPPQGVVVSNYIILRGIYDTNSGNYDYSQIGQVNAGTTSFEDMGAITGNNSYNNVYEIEAVYPDGSTSDYGYGYVPSPPSPPSPSYDNIYIAAYLIRNSTGRWQVMFSGLPTNSTQTIQLIWANGATTNILVGSLANGIYFISDADAVTHMGDTLSAQLFGPNGEPGQVAEVGRLAADAPYFVDGRQHMKQNLDFLIRAASINQLFYGSSITNFLALTDAGQFNQSATTFEEFSFLFHSAWDNGWLVDQYSFQLDNLWPFTANYDLANYLVDTTRTDGPLGSTNFNFQPDFGNSVPAPAILAQADPYWILQPKFDAYFSYFGGGSPPSAWAVSVNGNQTSASLASGSDNLFGLPFQNGCIIGQTNLPNAISYFSYQVLAPGNNVTTPPGYLVSYYANWCPAPTLNFVNYYFAPMINPVMGLIWFSGVNLPGEYGSIDGPEKQPFPMPIADDFNVTNQTPPVMVGSIGQPMILGGWAKYSVQGSSPPKYAYLGQYFLTNAFLLDANGNATTNSAGILSPYGEFFPLQAGATALVTMPDIDFPYQQGTGVVRVVSLNTDANHDGTLDFSYFGPDQTSPSRPLHFWVADDNNTYDFIGDGIPGRLNNTADGQNYSYFDGNRMPVYRVLGRRHLEDFFPVYLNIGSLFQSNALSAGISTTDTNWQFVLSQTDGALRFAYTDLTPTNYMNFLRDTNESGKLVNALLTTITPNGITLSNSFMGGIATNNQGIILVEAWESTTQPLILTIYHGTNQIAQTSLYMSISGVEQMFRHKNLMLNGTGPADRLTDASVPNEPDTVDKNFVFLHGYNVNTNEARGVAADMFKRMYWSGSHAKFWAVTWEGADTKGGWPFYSLFTPNYHTNVVNAFLTAPNLANFIATLTNSGPVVAAAHSLGNMVTLSAISDWNAPISQYFMMDAAVAMEAIDPNTPMNTNMVYSSSYSPWRNYSSNFWASYWYQLFPTNDARSTLAWNNRVGNLRNVDVYNFYSSGEEVLREYDPNPPDSVLSAIVTELLDAWPGGVPFGGYAWAWQEKGKGVCSQNWFLGSNHEGWQLNDTLGSGYVYFVNGLRTNIPPNWATSAPPSQLLVTNAFFNMSVDTAMFTTSTSGSTYAAANRNRILSDAIPALTLPAGANPVPKFAPIGHNADMQGQFENGWPAGRPTLQVGSPAAGEWHHSDFHQLAYTFTYKLFDQMVTTGNLK
jgi:hypothetical protein